MGQAGEPGLFIHPSSGHCRDRCAGSRLARMPPGGRNSGRRGAAALRAVAERKGVFWVLGIGSGRLVWAVGPVCSGGKGFGWGAVGGVVSERMRLGGCVWLSELWSAGRGGVAGSGGAEGCFLGSRDWVWRLLAWAVRVFCSEGRVVAVGAGGEGFVAGYASGGAGAARLSELWSVGRGGVAGSGGAEGCFLGSRDWVRAFGVGCWSGLFGGVWFWAGAVVLRVAVGLRGCCRGRGWGLGIRGAGEGVRV